MLTQNVRNDLTQKLNVLFSLTGQLCHIGLSVYFAALCVLRQSSVSSRVSWVALHWQMLPSNLLPLCYLSVKRVFRGGEYTVCQPTVGMSLHESVSAHSV